jgi:hypothetical protein
LPGAIDRVTVDQSRTLASAFTRQSLGRLPGYNWLEYFAVKRLTANNPKAYQSESP